jgi:hypothetical protein
VLLKGSLIAAVKHPEPILARSLPNESRLAAGPGPQSIAGVFFKIQRKHASEIQIKFFFWGLDPKCYLSFIGRQERLFSPVTENAP